MNSINGSKDIDQEQEKKIIDLLLSREEIDKIDKTIVDLFEKRMDLAKDVAAYKIKTGKKVFDKERELHKLKVVGDLASNEFNQQGIRELFSQIMSISRKLQYGLVSGQGFQVPFEQVDSFEVSKDTKIVCFGVEGSYTEQAMEEYFGDNITYFYAQTFKNVMESIHNGEAEYGVLPIENTSTGGITDIYDLLVQYNNTIIGEHIVKIDHALLGLPDATMKDIKQVYSHPQGLMQCSKFLEEHSEFVSIECLSTAASAKKVMENGDISQGAIASERAAACYGLKVLSKSINHEKTNSTRFIVISNKKEYRKGANKISICFELPHESGSLYNMLSHMIYNNLNMTKIESRPLEGRNFEYRFFIDFIGNLDDPGVKNALFGIQEEAKSLKILGNYPVLLL